jgi:hypothetical protein
MTDLPRLREESESALERALLDAGRSYRGSADMRKHTLAALGIGSATLLAGAASAAAPVSTLAKLAAKLSWPKVVVTASVISAAGAVPVGYHVWHEQQQRAAAGAHVVPAAARRPIALPEPVVPALVAEAPVVEPQPAPSAIVPHRERVAARRPRLKEVAEPRAALSMSGPTLTKELAALDAARSRLAEGRPERALDLLDTYARAYPNGRLALEAEVLRIEALAQSGQADAAHARAHRFLHHHPSSVFAARVRSHLDD